MVEGDRGTCGMGCTAGAAELCMLWGTFSVKRVFIYLKTSCVLLWFSLSPHMLVAPCLS